MRSILSCVALLMLMSGAVAAGQVKIDGKKLVGKWEPAPDKEKKEKPLGMIIEFMANGKVSLTVGEHKSEGTYKLESDKIAVQIKLGDQEIKETLTIKKLTDNELVTEDSKNKTETMRRK